MNKLQNFPPVYYITLQDSTARQQQLEAQLQNLAVSFTKIIAFDGRQHDFTKDKYVIGKLVKHIDSGHLATVISHLKAIEQWYYTSNSPVAIFLEDDMNLGLCKYWQFTWSELFARLDKYHWNVVQLSLLRGQDAEVRLSEEDMCFRRRSFYNWSVGAYMLTRNYAKRLLDTYVSGKEYALTVERWHDYFPYVENIIYIAARPHEFTIPLFTENINFTSTFYPQFINTKRKLGQIESSQFVEQWWQTSGKDISVDDFMQLKEARYWQETGTPSGWEFILK